MTRTLVTRSWLLIVVSILLALPSFALAGTCTSGCGTITVSQYTGPIDLGCAPGDIKVKIIVDYNCGPDCQGQVTFYRCGASSTLYQFNCNVNRIFRVAVNGTWADALTECNNVTFYEWEEQ
jgi:hypothetical protein